MRISLAIFAAFSLLVIGEPVLACSCVPVPPGVNTSQERAEWATQGKDAIFEGKVDGIELKWKFLEAPAGDLVPADVEQEPPEVEVSFEVLRSYQGRKDRHVKVRTGLGGGDCGFDFETSKKYLVFAYQDDSSELSTGICSSTALLEESQSNLAYLRGEPEIPARNREKSASDFATLCGQLVLENPASATDGEILLFRVEDKSLVPSDDAAPGADGSFCSHELRAGKYFVVFKHTSDESPDLFAFFPGVFTPSEAAEVEVAPPETVSHLLFKVPNRRTYTVGGEISAFNNSKREVEYKVMLVSAADRFLLVLKYIGDVAADGTFALRHVLPGKYWAGVMVESDGTMKWSTRRVEVDVDGDITGLNLELSAN